MLVDKADMEQLKRESNSTNVKLVTDINQRMYNLENRRNADNQLMQDMLEQQKQNNEIGKKTADILDRIERRLPMPEATPRQEPTP